MFNWGQEEAALRWTGASLTRLTARESHRIRHSALPYQRHSNYQLCYNIEYGFIS
jgi:hypothetical protein